MTTRLAFLGLTFYSPRMALRRRISARDQWEAKTPGRIYLTLPDLQALLDLLRVHSASIEARAGKQWDFDSAVDLANVPRRQRFPSEISTSEPAIKVMLDPAYAYVRISSPEEAAIELRDRAITHLREHHRWWVGAGMLIWNTCMVIGLAIMAGTAIWSDIQGKHHVSFPSVLPVVAILAIGGLSVWLIRLRRRGGATKLSVRTASEREAAYRDHLANLLWAAFGAVLGYGLTRLLE
jgi:hypothetical protein